MFCSSATSLSDPLLWEYPTATIMKTQQTLNITTPSQASEKCPCIRNVTVSKVDSMWVVSQWPKVCVMISKVLCWEAITRITIITMSCIYMYHTTIIHNVHFHVHHVYSHADTCHAKTCIRSSTHHTYTTSIWIYVHTGRERSVQGLLQQTLNGPFLFLYDSLCILCVLSTLLLAVVLLDESMYMYNNDRHTHQQMLHATLKQPHTLPPRI